MRKKLRFIFHIMGYGRVLFFVLFLICTTVFAQSSRFDKVVIGTSGNIWGFIDERVNPLCYEVNTQLLSYVFRVDPESFPDAQTNGAIVGSYSLDFGASWDTIGLLINPDVGTINPRYPSGVIYRPQGVSNPFDTYLLSAGPAHTDGNWDCVYFSSIKLDGTENHIDTMQIALMHTYGLTACLDHTAHFHALSNWSPGEDLRIYSLIGNWNTNHFVWDTVSFAPEIAIDSEGNQNWSGLFLGDDAGFNACWKYDGSIGYIVLIAQKADLSGGFEPMVFFSVDQGFTWTEIDIDFTPYQNEFIEYVPESPNDTVYPCISESDCIVDGEGNLQLFASIKGHQNIDPDSLGTILFADNGNLFNIVIDVEGVQNITWVDSLRTRVIEPGDEAEFGNGGVWNHRLNIMNIFPSDNYSGTILLWTDTYDEDYDVNARPNVFCNAYIENQLYYGETQYLTSNSGVTDGFYFFTHAAEFSMGCNISGYLMLPVSQVLSPPEYFNDDDMSPVSINFLNDLTLVGWCWSVSENDNFMFEVKLSPNPVKQFLNVDISSDLVLQHQIILYDITGTKLLEVNNISLNNGFYRHTFNTKHLTQGMYFITVENAKRSISKKIILE